MPRQSRELVLAIERVESARLLVSHYQANVAKLISERKPVAEKLASLETCQSALETLIAHERDIRKAIREKYYKKGKVASVSLLRDPSVPPDPTRISIRIDLTGGRIGPGKIAMLKAISDVGSISGAARKIKMSYRKAWLIVRETSEALGQPVITTKAGGDKSGAVLTPAGEQVIAVYQAIEPNVLGAVSGELEALKELVRRA